MPDIVESMEPINHAVIIDMNAINEGENTYICTFCKQPIILVWNGYYEQGQFKPTNYGLRHEDEHDAPIGEVKVTYL
jgi:hypothetical protein